MKRRVMLYQHLCWDKHRDAGTGGAGGAAAPLAFCWEGQGGQKCPLSIKNIILQLVFKVPLLIIKPVNWHCKLKKFGSY